ncbi:MAG: hypothetical protein OER85_13190 [Gammaproteobacteria bacterium]|nr:hypothetical protein [Gammaproteobacteria bacterium]
MKLYRLLIVGIALNTMGCAEKEQAAPENVAEAPVIAPAVEEPAAERQDWRDDTFLQHMHLHAEQLDQLNFALADGDLPSARTPAYWLSRHETVSGVKAEWQPYLEGMREAARAVEEAPDLDAAQAAAERINENCQGCHRASGVMGE